MEPNSDENRAAHRPVSSEQGNDERAPKTWRPCVEPRRYLTQIKSRTRDALKVTTPHRLEIRVQPTGSDESVRIALDAVLLDATVSVPADPLGVVLFAHGSGSSRLSPRNRHVANVLHDGGIGTVLLDLLTAAEDQDYQRRFDIALLTRRLTGAARWLANHSSTRGLAVGLFGASTGAAAALETAATLGEQVHAVVSRGGRPDLAGAQALRSVIAPTLLIVGGRDYGVIELNESAFAMLTCEKRLEIVPGATHLFEEPGALDEVALAAQEWFAKYLPHRA
jgi:putative phosphoribosyl transferase